MNPTLIIDKVLEHMTNDEDLEFFRVNIGNYKIEKIHKRRLSYVYSIDVFFPSLGHKNLSIKVVRLSNPSAETLKTCRNKLIKEFENHKSSYKRFESKLGHSIVKPIGVFPDELALVTETFHGGTTLESLISKNLAHDRLRDTKKLEELFFASGELLSQYHSSSLETPTDIQPRTKALQEYILVRLNLIYSYIEKNPISEKVTKNIAMFIDRFSNPMPIDNTECGSNLLTIVHGDFTPANILYNGEKLALIDFSEATSAPACTDIGCFVNYLEMLPLNKPVYSTYKIESLKNAFIRGYSTEKEVDHRLVKLYQFRYFSTNMLTQIYEMNSSRIKNIFLRPRIKRYISKLENYSFKEI